MADLLIDARDELSPIPILRASVALRDSEEGVSVELVTTGARSISDVPCWVEDMGYDLKETLSNGDGSTHFVIVKT